MAVATAAFRLHREGWVLRKLAARRGWQVSRPVREAWLARLEATALMRLGHSRRIEAAFQTSQQSWLFAYVYETGFEHRRETHSWRVTVREIGPRYGRATFTCQPWLIAAAGTPTAHRIALAEGEHVEDVDQGRTAVVEDRQAWEKWLRPEVRAWLGRQPPERSWEVLPGLLIGYEPGGVRETDLAELSEAAKEFASLLGE